MHPNVILLPLDARPVCLQLPLDAAVMAGILLHTPPKSALGVLKQPADLPEIYAWLEPVLQAFPDAPMLVSLDLIVYGGLIPSRLHAESLDTLKTRLQQFLENPLLENRRVYSFSSIMRIPNYNNAEEEPLYWAEEGEAIYQASAKAHASGDVTAAFQGVSATSREDFLRRRQLNFELNKAILDVVDSGKISQHLFAQDDTGEFGLNVQEAEQLKELADAKQLPVTVQTGADEIALILLSRSVLDEAQISPNITVEYWPKNSEKNIAKFDGLPLESVVQSEISACGASLVENKSHADLMLFVNGPRENRMGDHCENKETGPLTQEEKMAFIQRTIELLSDAPLAFADVAFANGADFVLVDAMLDTDFPFLDLLAYTAWNTPGNTIGTSVATALLTWHAQRNATFNQQAHDKLILTRLLDDWGYQASVRQKLRASGVPANEAELLLNNDMKPIEAKLKEVLDSAQLRPMHYSLPCQRYFEIEITF